ncbi:hypothetical protein, partial [Mycobacterium nebraskense]|uniref:hypothetical protein n=1 Tax=Mycobacterium nebraskense TaxID=244292 RepID=UPI001E2F6B52
IQKITPKPPWRQSNLPAPPHRIINASERNLCQTTFTPLLGRHRVTISSGDGPTDAPETINKVVALAEAFRPVEDVRVSGPGNQPKIDLVLSGDRLGPDELNLFLRSVQDLPADVMILPNGPDD